MVFKYLLLIVLLKNIVLVNAAQFERWHETAIKLDETVRQLDLETEEHMSQLINTLDRASYAAGGVAISSDSIVGIWVKATESDYQRVSESLTAVVNERGCSYVNDQKGIEHRNEGYATSKEFYHTYIKCDNDEHLRDLFSVREFYSIVVDSRFSRNIPAGSNFGGQFGKAASLKKKFVSNITSTNNKREISRIAQNYFPSQRAFPCLDKYYKEANWYLDALNNDFGIPDCVTLKEVEQNYGCEYVPDKGDKGTVFVVDTGMDFNHPEFSWGPNVHKEKILLASDVDASQGEDEYQDWAAHGTAITAMIVGENQGVAPKTQIYSMKILGMAGSYLPGYAFITALKIAVGHVTGGKVNRPHMVVSGFTHIEEAAPCKWVFSQFTGPLSTINCAFDSTQIYLEYIYQGGVYITPTANGIEYYRDPQYMNNPTFLGFDICDWAVFSNDYGYGIMYYPMYMLDGSEFSAYHGYGSKDIRPIRVGSHDRKGFNAKFMFKNYFDIGVNEDSTLSVGGSNYGDEHPYNSNVRCADYHSASSFMESFAVTTTPVLSHGSWLDCDGIYGAGQGCPDDWNPGQRYYEYPAGEYFATGKSFPSGYMKGGVTGTSFSTPLVGVALLATMLRQNGYFQGLNSDDVTSEAIKLLDVDINFDANKRTIQTIDDELTNSYESLDNNFGRTFYTGNVHTANSGGKPLDTPNNKNIRLRCVNPNAIPKPYDDMDKYDYGS